MSLLDSLGFGKKASGSTAAGTASETASAGGPPTADAILAALAAVPHPYLKKSLVALDMVKDISVATNGDVSLRVVLTTPADPAREEIESEVRGALGKVPGLNTLHLRMDAEVKNANRTHSHQGGTRVAGVSFIEGVAHIIAVSSGKGGVGKSTVSVNLATALALEGAKVGLMDADVYGPNIPTMMGVTEQPKITKVMKTSADGSQQEVEMFVPPTAHGVKVMSMGMLTQGDQPLVWRGPMLHSVINQFCHQVEWGKLDYLIVDMPPGTGDVQLSLAQMVPVTGAVLVTTPQEVSLQDVRKAYHMFDKVRVPILGIVENMSYFQPDDSDKKYYLFGENGGRTLAAKFNIELLAQFPLVPKVREGGDLGRPISIGDQKSEVSKGFRALCRRIAQKISIMVDEGVDPTQLIQIGKF